MKSKLPVGIAAALALVGMSLISPAKGMSEQELIVSAAASLTNAFQEIAGKFAAANPGTKVIPNFAASGALLQQMEKGAPVDVFASADQKTMNQAQERRLVFPETRKNFVSNGLVLILPVGSKAPVQSPQDLLAKEVTRVSLGNPETVPAGRYAREALENEGLWEKLGPKLIPGDHVRQVLDYVARGEVDAGFVFATDAAQAKDKVRVVAVLQKHQPILYPIAVAAATGKKDLAQRFVDFVLSREGQEILSRYGFGRP